MQIWTKTGLAKIGAVSQYIRELAKQDFKFLGIKMSLVILCSICAPCRSHGWN